MQEKSFQVKSKNQDLISKNIGNWSLKEYFDIIQKPTLFISVIGLILGIIGLIPLIGWGARLLASVTLWIGGICVTAYLGYIVVKKYHGALIHAIFAGGFAGLIIGITKGIIDFMKAFFSFLPGRMLLALAFIFLYSLQAFTGGIIISLIAALIAGGGKTTHQPTKSKN